jgi:alkylation response protein AidB-like acyl-CoA dehydrogenase
VAGAETWPVPAELQERSRLAKTFAARAAVEAATHAAMVAGGRCYTPHHPVFLFLCDALAGPLLRPPLPQAMDALVRRLFPPAPPEARALTA